MQKREAIQVLLSTSKRMRLSASTVAKILSVLNDKENDTIYDVQNWTKIIETKTEDVILRILEEPYPLGNAELLTMFKSKNFDIAVATRYIAEIYDISQPILDLDGYSTTYLYEAQSNNNVEAVRFLLEHGADPNYCNLDLVSHCALDDLHFLWFEMEAEEEQRLEITKLFFDYGGDPNLLIDGETLYDHVLWEVFESDHSPHDREYMHEFFKILIAYGGGGGESTCPKPILSEPIDRNRIGEYELKLILCDDGYHMEGHIFNPDGVDIGVV